MKKQDRNGEFNVCVCVCVYTCVVGSVLNRVVIKKMTDDSAV